MIRVTECLKSLGFMDDMPLNPHAMDRGTAAHAATAFFDEGDLDEQSVEPEIMPYLEAYRRWRREMPQFNLVEKPEYRLENEALGLRGTADRVMEAGNHWRYIIDIKTGSPAPWHRWQIALYRLLYSLQHKYGTPLGAALYLSSEGTYRYVEHKDRKDPDRARALVTAAHILKECRA